MRDATPEQILAINAGFSPAVANVMIEQARSKATGAAEQMALMREMIQQANDARVASEAQARHMFDSGMQGTVGRGAGRRRWRGRRGRGRRGQDAPRCPQR